MKNSKCLFVILCFCLLVIGFGIQNTFAQDETINDDQKIHVGVRFFPNVSTVYYSETAPSALNLNHYYWGLSSTMGFTVETRLLKKMYLTSGVEYANFTEVTSKAGAGFTTQPVEGQFDFTAKNRFGYITVPVGLKLIVVDKAKMDFYMTAGGRGMYSVLSLNVVEAGGEVAKNKLESNESFTINDWVWGGRASIGVEIPISSTTELFIEPTFEYYPQTNDIRFQNRFGDLFNIDRRMYAVGVALGVKL